MTASESSASPVRPLLVRCGALGDMVILTPLIRRLAERYGASVDLLSSGGWTLPLLRGQPHVGDLILLKSRKTPYWLSPRQWDAVATLRRRPRGPVFLCEDTPQTSALLRRAGIRAEDLLDAYAVDGAAGEVQRHSLERWQDLAERSPPAWPASGPPSVAPFVPRMEVLPAAQSEFLRWRARQPFARGPLVLLQPGNKRTLKRGRLATQGHHKHWPAERWAQLAAHVLAALPEAHVLLCGAPPERGVLDEIAVLCDRGRVHNLADDLPIPRLIALCAAARSMVSVDTVPAHLAAALNCPLVVLFGNASPARWAPRSPAAPVVCLGGDVEGLDRVEQIAAGRVLRAWDWLCVRATDPQPH